MISKAMFSSLAAAALLAGPLVAQTPAKDPSSLLQQVLPADVAERVLAKIAEARSHQLPAAALEQRALKFAAKGVDPADIERSVAEQVNRMEAARDALDAPRGRSATPDEIEAGAEALRKGVDGAQVSALAKTAPSGRSLTVPLYVIGGLIDRGLPSDEALQRVMDRIQARASDAEIGDMPADLPSQAATGQAHMPGTTGTELAGTRLPGTPGARAGGPPVPANAGATTRPTLPKPRGRSGGAE